MIPLGNGQNVSISSDTPGQVNATLWSYNLSGTYVGKELIKLSGTAPAGTTVTFEFTGLPVLSTGMYRVHRDGKTVTDIDTGGTVSWMSNGWSAHNFTVTHITPSTTGDEASDTSGGRVPVFCNMPGHRHDTVYELASANSTFTVTDGQYGINRLTLHTTEEVAQLQLCLRQLDTLPDNIPAVENQYQSYELYTQHEQNVTAMTVRFTVNRSFATRYDRIVVSRYDDGWTPLDTQRVATGDETWTYEATANDLSYFAVHGVTANTTPGNGTAAATNTTTNESATGTTNVTTAPNTTTDDPENQSTQTTLEDTDGANETAAPRPSRPADRETFLPPVIGLTLLLVILGVSGWYSYRRWVTPEPATTANRTSENASEGSTETNLDTLFEEVTQLVDDKDARHDDVVETKLQQAEFAREHDSPAVARNRLQELKDHLEQD